MSSYLCTESRHRGFAGPGLPRLTEPLVDTFNVVDIVRAQEHEIDDTKMGLD